MTNNKKIIFGFTGLISTGKDTAADYLKTKYQAATYSFTTMLSDAVKRFHLENSRDNLIKMSEIIRATFGEDTLAKAMAKDVENDSNNIIVVSNVRRQADIEYLKKLPGFVLVKITAQPQTRYERLIQRGQKSDDKQKTFEQFLADDQRTTELSILEVAKSATETVDNKGTIAELQQQLDTLVKKYAGSN